MTHVLTSAYYPQSNGKIERWHRSLKDKCIRPKCPSSIEEAKDVLGEWINHYNFERLHSAIGYVTPEDMVTGCAAEVLKIRDQRFEQARLTRRAKKLPLQIQNQMAN